MTRVVERPRQPLGHAAAQAEVDELEGRAGRGRRQEPVLGLQVAVADAARVHGSPPTASRAKRCAVASSSAAGAAVRRAGRQKAQGAPPVQRSKIRWTRCFS